ncbi:hypothetical protein L596_003801 [Steinernema carpocapsae]|uniref:Uncharacterized protein n=1 Tax=Steinernema carpocapsae TaxID=34508 RepID=A0A4U8UTQ4_STECR|nr:hypothetical protein L596_003801 [Steinernema carpocapsae]
MVPDERTDLTLKFYITIRPFHEADYYHLKGLTPLPTNSNSILSQLRYHRVEAFHYEGKSRVSKRAAQ